MRQQKKLGTFKMLYPYMVAGDIKIPIKAAVEVSTGEKELHTTLRYEKVVIHVRNSAIARYVDLANRNGGADGSVSVKGVAKLRAWDRPRFMPEETCTAVNAAIDNILDFCFAEWPSSIDELDTPDLREGYSYIAGVAAVFGLAPETLASLMREQE